MPDIRCCASWPHRPRSGNAKKPKCRRRGLYDHSGSSTGVSPKIEVINGPGVQLNSTRTLGLAANITLGTERCCLGFPDHISCVNTGDIASFFAASLEGQDGLGEFQHLLQTASLRTGNFIIAGMVAIAVLTAITCCIFALRRFLKVIGLCARIVVVLVLGLFLFVPVLAPVIMASLLRLQASSLPLEVTEGPVSKYAFGTIVTATVAFSAAAAGLFLPVL